MTTQTIKKFKTCKQGYYELAHYFAYAEEHEEGMTSCDRMSFKGNKVYSYSTQIAERAINKDNQKVLLVTENRHSNTTIKQISILTQSWAYNHIYMPSKRSFYSSWTQTEFNPIEAIKIYLDRLKEYDLLKKDDRQSFKASFNNINNFDIDDNLLNQVNEYKNIYDDLLVSEDKYKSLARKESAKKASEAKKEYKEKYKPIIESLTYTQKIRLIYDNSFYMDSINILEKLTSTEQNKIKEYIKKDIPEYIENNYNRLSYIWIENNTIKTSLRITIDNTIEFKKCIRLMHAYLKCNNQECLNKFTGLKINGMYEIQQANNEFVKVGCHTIPKQNIIELLKEFEG